MLYTPKKTFDLILSLNCHFLAQIKRNCRKLWETIALFTAFCEPISTCEYYQSEQGREVYRRVELYENKATLPKGWNGIERFVKVRRWGIREQKPFHHVAFYALSKPINSALIVARAIQGHWSIENDLHCVKDVCLGEDDTTCQSHNQATLLAYFNNTALNILRDKGYKPCKDTFAKFANKVNELSKLFNFYT